jgi:ZIP family zinc transporter
LLDTGLGFTAGVMIAAIVWSLLVPSIDMSLGDGLDSGWRTAKGDF